MPIPRIFARPLAAGPVLPGSLRAVALAALAVLAAWPGMAAAKEPIKILAFGDSLIHGYGLPAGETFPELLEAALRESGLDARVINGGNSGDTSAAGRARLDWALAADPDLVLLELGGNDGLRGIDPAATLENLDAILARLRAEGLPVLFAGMLAPRNLGADYAAEFDAVFPRLAAKHGVAFYPFFLDGVAMQPGLNQSDGIHPNGTGVRVIVQRILPRLLGVIEDMGAHPAGAAGAPSDG
jgi:acyl-CoA thioesterase-1